MEGYRFLKITPGIKSQVPTLAGIALSFGVPGRDRWPSKKGDRGPFTEGTFAEARAGELSLT